VAANTLPALQGYPTTEDSALPARENVAAPRERLSAAEPGATEQPCVLAQPCAPAQPWLPPLEDLLPRRGDRPPGYNTELDERVITGAMHQSLVPGTQWTPGGALFPHSTGAIGCGRTTHWCQGAFRAPVTGAQATM